MKRNPSGFYVYWRKEEDSKDFEQIAVFGDGIREHLLSRLEANTSYVIQIQVFFSKHKGPKSKAVASVTMTRDEGKIVLVLKAVQLNLSLYTVIAHP
jgi:hypothetical protein